MRFLLQTHQYHADIVDQHTGRTMARVYITGRQPYPVLDDQGGFLFAVWALDEAVREFERSYTEAPWQPVYTAHSQQGLPSLFIKRTPFGELRVQHDHSLEKWIALRDGEMLLYAGKRATFGSCGAAQAAAEKYLRTISTDPGPVTGPIILTQITLTRARRTSIARSNRCCCTHSPTPKR